MLFLSTGSTIAAVSDLTIAVGGDLLEHGGVVVFHHLPESPDTWGADGGDVATQIQIEARYAEVQIRYPADGSFSYRFRPVEGTEAGEKHETQVLSVIGTDMEGHTSPMTMGFEGVPSSGGRIIRVPSMAELVGEDEATRSNARWGITEGFADPPPADERSARSLVAIVDFPPSPIRFQCTGDERVQSCTPLAEEWSGLEARWWRSIAEARLERLEYHALRRCYDGGFFSAPSRCDPDTDSNEPRYIGRN